MARASSRVSQQITELVIITLSFLNCPIGSVQFAMPCLYASIRPRRLKIGSKLKAIAPMPISPAVSNVGGLPHATQIGGCPFPYGLGRMLCGYGTVNDSP